MLIHYASCAWPGCHGSVYMAPGHVGPPPRYCGAICRREAAAASARRYRARQKAAPLAA